LLKKNDILDVTITAISHQGSGIARHEGMAVFIPGTAQGDRLRARVVKGRPSYAYGIQEELLEPSPHRIPPDCPAYPRCGGCSLRQMDYGAELEVKARWVTDNLQRIGGIRVEADPAIPSPRHQRYRNKAQFPVRMVEGRPRTGFFGGRTHNLIPVGDCPLQPRCFTHLCGAVLAYMEEYGIPPYDELSHKGVVRHIYLRLGESTGEVMVCLVINAGRLPHTDKLLERLDTAYPQVATLVLSHNRERTNVILGRNLSVLRGAGAIRDRLCGLEVNISAPSFYQVNREAAQLLYQAAAEYAELTPEDVLLDLYCGAGTIGLSMAHLVREVIGVEVTAAAVEDARRAAAANGITNARFLCGDAAAAAARLEREGVRPDVVVLDPPRKGAEAALLETIALMSPQRVVYISCNSATLARDCKYLEGLGYRTERVRAADLFPRTAHVEAVALLKKVPF